MITTIKYADKVVDKCFPTTFELERFMSDLRTKHADATFEHVRPTASCNQTVLIPNRLAKIIEFLPHHNKQQGDLHEFELSLMSIASNAIARLMFVYSGDRWCFWQVLFKHEGFIESNDILAEALRLLVTGGSCVLLDERLNEYVIVNNLMLDAAGNEVDALVYLNRKWAGIF